MNIVFLGHHDIASLTAINSCVTGLPEHSHTVLLSTADGDKNPLLGELAAADAELCEQFLAGELGSAPHDSILNRHKPDFERPNSEEGLETLREFAPDLIVSIRYRKILHAAAIAIPRLGVINLHSGILPDYRGVMATFWAMLDGQPEIGTTLHRITDSGIDTGPVINIDRRPVDPARSYLSNVLSLYPAGGRSIIAAVRELAAGSALDGHAQHCGGRYFSAPDQISVQRFANLGLRLVDGGEAKDLATAPF